MKKVFLSKSSYCKYVQCPKILWLKKYKPKEAIQAANPAVFEMGKKVGILAQDLFGKKHDDIHYEKNLYNMIDLTSQYLLNKPNIITEASFIYDNNFCMVDILKNDYDGVEIYEVKSSTKISDVYLDDISFQYYVLSSMGFKVKKASIVHINNEYVRQKELDIEELFKVEDVTSIAQEKQEAIKDNIEKANQYMRKQDKYHEPLNDLGLHCCTPYDCDFWEYCTRDLPEPNIFSIKGNMTNETKFEKYSQGKVTFEDLVNEDLTDKQLEQIDFEINDRQPKIEKEEIKKIMDSLNYPLYFLDYETYNTPIPEIEGTRPYQQLPFQYSLHILKEEGAPLEHREFLADVNDNEMIRHFAESMVNDLQDNGSVIVYNKSFECANVNRKLVQMYPDLQEKIERINNRMIDFMEPFRQRHYYTRQMEGSYSIKNVLPALYPDNPELDYEELSVIHNGEEAQDAFRTLNEKTSQEQEKIRRALLEYCELDTHALVKIYEKFKEIIRQ